MYPSIKVGGGGDVPSHPLTSLGSFYPTVGQGSFHRASSNAAEASSSNGPAPSSPNTQNPLLRVHIAEQYRTLPPVMVSPGLEDIPRTAFTYNFEVERRVRDATSPQLDQSSDQPVITDPWDAPIGNLRSCGFSREEAGMALAALGTEAQNEAFCRHYREIKSMGFEPAVVVGSLLMHRNDLPAATDACINAQ